MPKDKAINIFDFDGTLTTDTWPKFWVWVKKFGYDGSVRNDLLEEALAQYRTQNPGNHLETFFGFFNNLLLSYKKTLSSEELMEGEKYINYYEGVEDFLHLSRADNYIVSSGLKDFLSQLEIAPYFKNIYGTSLIYNPQKQIVKIGEVMNDNKKIKAIQEILKLHNKIDCHNVYYIGDGYSDAPAMRFVHNNGGKTIFVYPPNLRDGLYESNKKIYADLKKEGIVDYLCEANYYKGNLLYDILERKA